MNIECMNCKGKSHKAGWITNYKVVVFKRSTQKVPTNLRQCSVCKGKGYVASPVAEQEIPT